MGSRSRLCLFLLFALAICFLITSGGAFELAVGSKDGWVTNPSESYASWAGRLRFSVNDTLVFVYDKSVDSVLEVTSADYTSCNATSPITKLVTGRDNFKLSRSGPFFFISGNASHCQAGQKVIVVVLAIRSPPAPPALTPPPATATPTPAPATTTTPAPGSAPISGAPTTAPTPSPAAPTLAPTSSTSPPSESTPGSSITAGPARSPGPSPSSPASDTSNASPHSAPSSSATVLTAAVLAALFGSALLV